MSSSSTSFVISETTEILIDLGPMKDTVHQISSQPGSSLLTSMYAQKISPKIVHVCFICDKMFINRISLSKHLTKHNIVVKGATSSVNEDGSNAANNDQEKITPPGKISCGYCRGLFDNQEVLMKHEQNIHYLFEGSIMEKHCCGYCGVKFSRRRDLFHHIRCCGTLSAVDNCKLATEINMRANSNKQSDESSHPSTQVEYFCLNCKQKRSFKILSLDRASKLLKLNCQTCGKPLHLTYFASEPANAKEPQTTDNCDTTAETCQDNGSLTPTPQSPLVIDDNNPVTNDNNPVTNDEEPRDQTPVNNDKKVVTKTIMKLSRNFPQVIKILNKKSKFKCHICYKKFTSLDILNNHFNSAHAGVRRQKSSCPYCSKSFITAKLYLRHLQSHVRLKKISCHYQLLSKSTEAFYDIFDYQHNGKRHTCLHCSESFSNSVELLNHHKEYHPNNSVHVCQVCSCQFVSENSLKQHRKRHSVKNFYKCDFCFKTFTKMSLFLQHILQHAKISF
ncbi:zinc finger protein 62 homolog [Octopus bimaculoides]|uniref:C2H2-type domain-containing protein n=1 Tax=Octopus bimaculoides TaxID=37653 RepID=A0A0L8IHJ9_OCTBM|nr:zinc finger protein 62 homolog [Octopus bimaculoides]XP_052831681.1 zinc finger protein 62 homolog [Octopus bimaculoides]|eukprot:XP_014774928.1 PREDICTED: zinc finger protein 62 homolog [Octopus bimaculoides]